MRQAQRGRSWKWSGRGAPALLLAPVSLLAWLGWRHRWMSEDAFILLRVVQNLLDGRGPVWNVDERVEVYTSPLWVGFLSLGAEVLGAVRLEWIAVCLGLLCSAGGLLAAERGALLLARARAGAAPALPLGGLVIAALPPYWYYATSGLESGIVLAWLGTCFWGLVRVGQERDPGAPAGLGLLIGLGPLVRPDLALMSAGFLLLLLGLHRAAGGGHYLRLLAATAALPALYEVFRMGYFATIVPNTALAKEAFGAYWDQGWRYLKDFGGTYWLGIPCLALLAPLVLTVRDGARRRHAPTVALVLVPVACGLLHAAYVVRLGGDFMHGRMLLPSLFTLLLPVSVVAMRPWPGALAALIVVPWAIACALWLRVPYPDTIGPAGIADERGVHAASVGRLHPVTLEDYETAYVTYDGRALRHLAAQRRALLLGEEITPDKPAPLEVPLAPRVATRIVAGRPNIGLLGYAAGPSVHVVDRLGLGDAVAARLRVEQRGRPGHEKWLSDAWIAARFAEPTARLPAGVVAEPLVAAARAALACGPLRDLVEAIEAPLTPARFLGNLAVAWRLRGLTVPADPARAVSELCGR